MIPFVTIELDRPRRIRFGMESIIEYEQLTGNKVQAIDEDMSYYDMARLLWCMLRQDEPELTLEQTIKLVDDHAESIPYVSQKVSAAIVAAYNTGKRAKNA